MSTLTFLQDVARRPLEMGAILPSSRHLARAMVACAAIEPGDVVLELGAGSGSFTQEIVARHPLNRLVLVEPGEGLAAGLRVRFPRATVTTTRAEELLANASSLGIERIDRVVSGLPWALWTLEKQGAILDAFVPRMSPMARFVTFHYVHSRALGRVTDFAALLRARFGSVTQSSAVWANVPPAFVHIATDPLPA